MIGRIFAFIPRFSRYRLADPEKKDAIKAVLRAVQQCRTQDKHILCRSAVDLVIM